MQHRAARFSSTRFSSALIILFSLAASPLPASVAAPQENAGGRPRRAVTRPSTTGTSGQTATQISNVTSAAPTAAQKTATPTPTPTPPAAGAPKLQTTPGVTATPTPDPQDASGQEIDPDEVVTVEQQLVNLNVRVVDRYNRPIKDVRKEDFKVFDNGVLQTVEFFEQREVPISYGIVVDNSGSLRSQINQVIDASKTIINSNREGDETFVVRFIASDEIKILQDWTASKQELNDAMEDMFVEGGQTAVVDAVYLAAEHAGSHKKEDAAEDKRRRALILVTDGEDRNSFYKREQLIESLRENDVQIFVIGFVNELEKEGGIIRKSKREKAQQLLDQLSKETGGRAFYPNSLSELPGIAAEITKDMRTQYVVGYLPSNKARPGEFRPVRVQIADAPNREKRIAVTRAGYTAPRAGGGGGQTPQANNRPGSANRP